jgi:coenzyme F420-reducing hydrogenase alpha subunit
MEKIIPRQVVPIDYRFLYDVANLYYSAGDVARYREIATYIEPIAEQNMNESLNSLQSPYNSFSMLERMYVNLKEYNKAIEVLEKLQNMMPNAGGVQEEINRLKIMAKRDSVQIK